MTEPIKYNNKIEYEVYGRYALFTDPVSKIGGEKFSYQIPTYQALVGITEAIYWKPTFIWVIDKVRIMNPIRTEVKGVRPVDYHGNSPILSAYTYLRQVHYQVQAHFEWDLSEAADKLYAKDRKEDKHWEIARHSVELGGKRDVFLGTRECQAYVDSCTFGEGKGYYDHSVDIPFGLMVHGLNYVSDANDPNITHIETRFWQPVMKNGVITFVRPEECPLVRPLTDYDYDAKPNKRKGGK